MNTGTSDLETWTLGMSQQEACSKQLPRTLEGAIRRLAVIGYLGL